MLVCRFRQHKPEKKTASILTGTCIVYVRIKRVISNDQAAVSGSDITSELRAVTLVPTPTKPLASMYKGLNTCNDGIHHSKNDSIHYMFLDNYVHHDL